HTQHVRIFTPAREIPFAGHPNVGTAFVLASAGEFGEIKSSLTVTFEEEAGLVSVTIVESSGKVTSCELTAPQSLSFGRTLPVELVAAAISIDSKDIVTKTHGPQVVSVGRPFIFVELRDRSVLERARINMSGFEALAARGVMPDVYLYILASDGFDIRARMFAPLSGVPEDPATGSANCTLAGLLAHYNQDRNGSFSWRIAQGVEMGRPSTLIARAEKKDGVVQISRIDHCALAVVISLFYVAHSIRQNTNAVRSATAQAVHEHFASWYHLLAARSRIVSARRQRITRLLIAFRVGESAVDCDLHWHF